MRIEYEDTDFPSETLRTQFSRAAEEAQISEALSGSDLEVDVRFVSEAQMRELNLEYRGIDAPTDVLSFPMYESVTEIRAAASDADRTGMPPVLLGDVALCEPVAARQAAEYGNTAEQELTHLFVHSLLHLLGYDHERDEDYRDMITKEKVIMEVFDVN